RGKFLSYGPCQTPVLYLVVKRAIERETFKRKKFYEVVAELEAGGWRFKAKLGTKFESRDKAVKAAAALRRARIARVVRADYVERSVEPPEPLATVELERRASRFLDIRPKEAMDIAEDLYQEGLISYPRTDTTKYPPTLNLRAIAAMFTRHEELGRYVRSVILSRPRLRVRQGREDDRAHPPIYPLKYVPRDLVVRRFGVKGWRLYDLVVRHFLATLSPPMRAESQRVEVEAAGLKLSASGLKVLEPGYTLVYHYERPRESPLPRLSRGQEVRILEVRVAEGETKPPPYLSESELLKLMKRYGIGTDATMQDHIHTNVERRYFRVVRKRCIPTPLGRALIEALSEVVPEAVLPEVRGRMEAELRAIVEGLKEPDEVIREMKERFYEYLQRLKRAEERVAERLVEAVREVFGTHPTLSHRPSAS
ncbi:MAG: type IA DNA topoisomerase, partial [Thermoprotei archaeon]